MLELWGSLIFQKIHTNLATSFVFSDNFMGICSGKFSLLLREYLQLAVKLLIFTSVCNFNSFLKINSKNAGKRWETTKVNDSNRRMSPLLSSLLSLNIFLNFFQCSYYWFWTSECLLRSCFLSNYCNPNYKPKHMVYLHRSK